MSITAIFIVGFVVLGIYKLFELYAKRDERKSLIEKLPIFMENKDSTTPIILPNILYKKNEFGPKVLRFALLLIGIGLGAAVAFFVQWQFLDDSYNVNVHDWVIRRHVEDMQAIIYFSFIAFFGGIGLLIAYLIEQKQVKNN